MILRNSLNLLEPLILQKARRIFDGFEDLFKLKESYIFLRVLPLCNIQISFQPYTFQILRKNQLLTFNPLSKI